MEIRVKLQIMYIAPLWCNDRNTLIQTTIVCRSVTRRRVIFQNCRLVSNRPQIFLATTFG